MRFTVLHKGETGNGEYRAYVHLLSRQLLQRGIGLDNLPRVRDEGGGPGWYYVWDKEEEAKAFARDLKTQTGDHRWHVTPVTSTPSPGPLRPLELRVGRQHDGWVFALEPLTRVALQLRFPESCRRGNVFVGANPETEFQVNQDELRELARQVLLILTGLPSDQLRAFHNFRLVDPVTWEELLPATPVDRACAPQPAGGVAVNGG